MDDVEKAISEIKADREIMNTRFTGLANDAGDILEKHGWGTTEAFLLERKGRGERQATALLKVLKLMESYPSIRSNRKVGRLIIKALDSLTKEFKKEARR